MSRCPRCNSTNVLSVDEKAGKCRDCKHWWGETMCIAMDLHHAFIYLFGHEWDNGNRNGVQ